MIALLRALLIFLLSLRYRVRIRGLEQVTGKGTRGILFLPNHPALIDPIILIAHLHRRFEPRALADRDQISRPPASWFARLTRVRPVLDIARYGDEAREEIRRVLLDCAEGLKQGENILLYPSGHLYRSRYEQLRGNSAVQTILQAAPDARIVLVRTTGLWGSSFSLVSGSFPDMGAVLRKAARSVLANFIFFGPRRDVTIELVDADEFPRSADRNTQNAWLEEFYNRDAPPALYVPYTIWEKGGRQELPDPELGGMRGDPSEVPPATRNLVSEYLQNATGVQDFTDDSRLGPDLGLDSLAKTELMLWLGREFGFHGGDVAALQTVGDVMLAARGQTGGARVVELKPIPRKWFRSYTSLRPEIPPGENLIEVFLRQARRGPGRVVVADQLSGPKTYRDLITAILALRPAVESLPGQRIGIMLPASVAAAVSWLTAICCGKVPVLVNWTTGSRNIRHALESLDVRHVITAGPLVARVEAQGVDLSAVRGRLVYLEQLGAKLTRGRKLRAALTARLSWRSLERAAIADTAAILLTSGSEALPKAVPLSHKNILANLRDTLTLFTLRSEDRLIGFLPPFHSFGLSVTTVLPLATGVRVVYHANPTEPWVLARMIQAYGVTLVVGTPTFLAGIVRASTAGQLESLRLAVTGAEKCPEKTYAALAQACPRAIVLEGYGVTECSPIIAANSEQDPRPGTIGRVLPSYEYALMDVERDERVQAGEIGMLLVRGPSVFDGYLGDTAGSPFVEFEGKSWYRTGDLVRESADGVLTFSGRLKRFIKLGGEMISLPAIESVLMQHYGSDAHEGPVLAVEATPSEDQPEIVLFTTRPIERSEANANIRAAHLSPLHNISRVVPVDEIPVLGTGKTDYRALRSRLAQSATT